MNDIRICDLRDGMEFTCKILGCDVKRGFVAIEDGRVYLCQDDMIGEAPRDKRGFEYGWDVGSTWNHCLLESATSVTDFVITDDSNIVFRAGDIITKDGGISYALVLFANEYMVARSCAGSTPDIEKLKDKDASEGLLSCAELKRRGWKRYVPETVSDEDVEEAIKTLETAGRIVDGKVVTDA